MKLARLILEDGTVFTGKAFGSEGESVGEVVFHTGVTSYQDVLSDAAYCGQIVTMTTPLIGNYGLSRDDFESARPFVHGLVVREYEAVPSNWRAVHTIEELMKEHGIIGISGIDTRMLTKIIRSNGSMKGLITTSDGPAEQWIERLGSTGLVTDPVRLVSTNTLFHCPGDGARIVLIDFGSKKGILKELTKRGCDVVVVPHDVTVEQIRRLNPDGIQLSDGPGDPKQLTYAVQVVAQLLGEYPIFGISLGHQLLALACGADTEKMKYGHRGGNYPVKELRTNRCFITSQNHGYAVKFDSLTGTGLHVTHTNNNDGTIEGLEHSVHPAFSVQYHPEAGQGTLETDNLFDRFLAMIHRHQEMNPLIPSQARFVAAKKGELQYAQK